MKATRFLALVLAILFVLPLAAACGKSGQKTTLYVLNWGEYLDPDLIKEFEDQNPDIKINYTTTTSNEEMYTICATEGSKIDLLVPSDYMIERLIAEDLLADLDLSNIPNFEYVKQAASTCTFDPESKYSIPYLMGTLGIVYNTKLVDDPVDSWDSLWNEKYKDQILMFNNSRDAFGIAEKKLGYSQNSTSEEELRACMEELKKQKPVVQSYVMDEIFNKMEGGSAALAPYYAGDAITMAENNPDLKFAIPKEGTNRFIDSMVVFKGIKHKKEAELFINFMCETEIGLANSEVTGYSTPLKNVYDALDDDVKNNKIAYPDQSVLEKCESFKNLPTETNKLMDELWMEIITDNN